MPGKSAAENFNPLSRVVPLAALISALIGIAFEFGAHRLLYGRRGVWLIKPYVYVGLPKPFVHTDWISVAVAIVAAALMLFWALLRKAPAKPALPFMWLGLGMILGGEAGDALTGIVLGTSTNILALTRGAWGYAFSPFDLAAFIGVLLFLPGFLRDTKDSFRWRALFQRREDSDG